MTLVEKNKLWTSWEASHEYAFKIIFGKISTNEQEVKATKFAIGMLSGGYAIDKLYPIGETEFNAPFICGVMLVGLGII